MLPVAPQSAHAASPQYHTTYHNSRGMLHCVDYGLRTVDQVTNTASLKRRWRRVGCPEVSPLRGHHLYGVFCLVTRCREQCGKYLPALEVLVAVLMAKTFLVILVKPTPDFPAMCYDDPLYTDTGSFIADLIANQRSGAI